jgi:DNA-binding MarR family transcriptional regulator
VQDDDLITNWGLLVEGYSRAMHVLEGSVDDTNGLGPTWFGVLLRLERTPDHRLPMTQLAREVELTSGGFTKVADKLAEAGFTRRVACQHDRRVTWMELTDEGLRTAQLAKAQHARTLRKMVEEHLGIDELVEISRHMRKLRDNLDAASGCLLRDPA